MKNIYLSLGSNKDNKLKYIDLAIGLIENNIGEILLKSKIYESKAWGFQSKDLFLNMVIEIESKKSPTEILKTIHLIEKKLSREKNDIKYSDRTIDIDILFYGDKIIVDDNLCIPHPLLHLRDFCVVPLKEIAPEFMHPILKRKVKEM